MRWSDAGQWSEGGLQVWRLGLTAAWRIGHQLRIQNIRTQPTTSTSSSFSCSSLLFSIVNCISLLLIIGLPVVRVFEKQNLSINPSNIFIIFHNSRAGVLAELEQCAPATNITASPHNIVSFSSLQNHKIALLLESGSNGNTQMEILKLFLFERKNRDFVLVRGVKK